MKGAYWDMVFSSPVFLFVFLPIVLLLYYGIFRRSRRWQNIALTLASLFFYAWGEPVFVFIMLGSILINWCIGLLISRYQGDRKPQNMLVALAVAINIGILFVFKYLSFFINTLTGTKALNIALPIGISFFTFQAMSYVFDIQRGRGQARKNPLDVALYISFFPQLIAGPIVRYETIAEQINDRRETPECFANGVERFILGFAKKILLANSLARVADYAMDNPERTFVMAWVGAIAYTLQIFFDFSGYSDMAIGLGKMFGFRFNENFNYPYIAKSISEFWRRWHISLGSWFRDYVYFPLGGSRVKTKARLVFNLFVVWFLTGVWHGANWTFLVWGLMYFVLIASEKLTGFASKLGKFGHVYTLIFVVFGWVLFRAESLAGAADYMMNMLGIGVSGFFDGVAGYWLHEYRWQFIFAIVFSTPAARLMGERFKGIRLASAGYQAFISALLLFAIVCMLSSSYNPFIYFNF